MIREQFRRGNAPSHLDCRAAHTVEVGGPGPRCILGIVHQHRSFRGRKKIEQCAKHARLEGHVTGNA